MKDIIYREDATRYFIGLQALDKITNENYDGKITFEEVISRLGVVPSAELMQRTIKLLDDGTLIVPTGFEPSKIKSVLVCPNDSVDAFLYMPSAERTGQRSELLKDGTLMLSTDLDIAGIKRIILQKEGTHFCSIFYLEK